MEIVHNKSRHYVDKQSTKIRSAKNINWLQRFNRFSLFFEIIEGEKRLLFEMHRFSIDKSSHVAVGFFPLVHTHSLPITFFGFKRAVETIGSIQFDFAPLNKTRFLSKKKKYGAFFNQYVRSSFHCFYCVGSVISGARVSKFIITIQRIPVQLGKE